MCVLTQYRNMQPKDAHPFLRVHVIIVRNHHQSSISPTFTRWSALGPGRKEMFRERIGNQNVEWNAPPFICMQVSSPWHTSMLFNFSSLDNYCTVQLYYGFAETSMHCWQVKHELQRKLLITITVEHNTTVYGELMRYSSDKKHKCKKC